MNHDWLNRDWLKAANRPVRHSLNSPMNRYDYRQLNAAIVNRMPQSDNRQIANKSSIVNPQSSMDA